MVDPSQDASQLNDQCPHDQLLLLETLGYEFPTRQVVWGPDGTHKPLAEYDPATDVITTEVLYQIREPVA